MISFFKTLLSISLYVFILNSSLIECSRVKLRDVEVLTLHKDKQTTGRRARPVPQVYKLFIYSENILFILLKRI
jgi:hypothetical protein